MFSNRSLVIVLAPAAALCATTMIAAPPARADGYFAAVAFSPSSNDKYFNVRASSRSSAEQDAMQSCSKDHNDCVLVGSTDRCLALAVSGSQYKVGFGDTASEAQAAALGKLPGGTVSNGHCASDTT